MLTCGMNTFNDEKWSFDLTQHVEMKLIYIQIIKKMKTAMMKKSESEKSNERAYERKSTIKKSHQKNKIFFYILYKFNNGKN